MAVTDTDKSEQTPQGQRVEQRRTRWSVRRRTFTWILVTFAFWVVVAGIQVAKAKSEAEAGEVALRSVADVADPTEMDLDEVAKALSEGGENLKSADGRLNSWVLKPLRVLPFAGRQFDSVRGLVGSASEVVINLEPIVDRVRSAQADPSSIDRVDFLNEIGSDLQELEGVLQELDLGPENNLLSPLADARVEFSEQLVDLSGRSHEYSQMLTGLAHFLDSGSYLLLGTNNAEMRIGSGMHLSIGQLETLDGTFELGGLEPARTLEPVYGANVVDQDVETNWGFLDLASDFRKLGYSGRFDEFVAPQALAMWSAKRHDDLDGVILLDPFVLQAVLSVVGPVEVDGTVVSSSEVLTYLLEDQYTALGNDVDEAETEARDNRLSMLAVATAQSFQGANWDPLELIRALKPVAEGRHLMLYSLDETEQAAWRQLGVDGSMNGDEIGVFWLNTAASKLDPFLDVHVDVLTTDHESDENLRQLTITVTTISRASEDLPSYIVGPWEYFEVSTAGAYRGRLALYLPGDSRDIRFSSGESVEVLGIDGNSVIVSTGSMEILAGSTATHVLYATLPRSTSSIVVLPSARYPAEQWNWNGDVFDDSIKRRIELD